MNVLQHQPKANELHMSPLPLEKFHYHKDSKSLTAEDSDLRDHKFDGTYRYLQQIWNDSADVGIAIRSEKTGVVEKFYLSKQEERDGDLLAFHFEPVNAKLSTVESVVIFND